MDQHQIVEVEVWKQLFEEMRYYATFSTNLMAGSFLLLGASSALMHYFPEVNGAVWIAGFILIGILFFLIRKVGNQQEKAYCATLEIQKKIIPEDFEKSMNELMKSKKPLSSRIWFQVLITVLLIAFWGYMGYLIKAYEIFIK